MQPFPWQYFSLSRASQPGSTLIQVVFFYWACLNQVRVNKSSKLGTQFNWHHFSSEAAFLMCELKTSSPSCFQLSVIAITSTLVSVSNASFIPEQERKRKLVRQATHGAMQLPDKKDSSAFSFQQEQVPSHFNAWQSYSYEDPSWLFLAQPVLVFFDFKVKQYR